jgi:hypothetical protein
MFLLILLACVPVVHFDPPLETAQGDTGTDTGEEE